MVVHRVIWIVIVVLLIAVAFTGGILLGSMSVRRAAFAESAYGPGMMRAPGAFAPNLPNRGVPPNGTGRIGPGMNGGGRNGFGMMHRRVAPNSNRGMGRGNNGRGILPNRRVRPNGR